MKMEKLQHIITMDAISVKVTNNKTERGAVMSEYNKCLDNMETYAYLLSHFGMTCDEAADEMKKRGLFDDDVAIVHHGVSNYMELINKQKIKENK